VVEQHALEESQLAPFCLQGGAPLHVPFSHFCAQHSAGDEQVCPSDLQDAWHTPLTQVFEQQFHESQHCEPSGLHG
jgi:hypothetical protein